MRKQTKQASLKLSIKLGLIAALFHTPLAIGQSLEQLSPKPLLPTPRLSGPTMNL